MHVRFTAIALMALITVAACTSSSGEQANAGARQDVVADPERVLYSPESADALALGLPDLVGGYRLRRSDPLKTDAEEYEYFTDPRVRQILVNGGLGPSRVTIQQKSSAVSGPPSGEERIPTIAVAAVQVKDVAAHEFIEWDPTFYMLVTSVDGGDYEWQGEKPDDDPVVIADRTVRVADFDRFKVAWYPYGDVLYVIVAASDQLLDATVKRLPWSPDAA